MNGNFSAKQIAEVVNKVETLGNDMKNSLTNICDNFEELSIITTSEDSSLTTTCKNIRETYLTLNTKLEESLKVISNTLRQYMGRTVDNEYNLSNNLKRINVQLEQINNMLSRI